MKVVQTQFTNLLKQSSFAEHGDRYEKKYAAYLSSAFPNCEKFWQVYVVPLTKRIEGYPNNLTKNINLRDGADSDLENIANLHYSMFMNLAFAHLHLETKIESSIENIYAHIGSACDLAEAVIENLYILLMECQGNKVALLQELTRDNFLDYAGKWFDEKYKTIYEYYKLKGKIP